MKPSQKTLFTLGNVLFLLVAFPCSAWPKELRLTWSELAPFILRQDVALVLPNGAFIEGNAVAVRSDALVIHVRRTTNAKAYPKGQNDIPRGSVAFLRVTEIRGTAGRLLGGMAGAFLGLELAISAIYQGKLDEQAAVAALLGITAISTAAGDHLGSKLDKRITSIRIVAD